MYHNHNTKHNHIDANENQFILAVTKCKFKPFYYYKTRNLDPCILKIIFSMINYLYPMVLKICLSFVKKTILRKWKKNNKTILGFKYLSTDMKSITNNHFCKYVGRTLDGLMQFVWIEVVFIDCIRYRLQLYINLIYLITIFLLPFPFKYCGSNITWQSSAGQQGQNKRKSIIFK